MGFALKFHFQGEAMIYESLEGKRFILQQDPYIDGPTNTRSYYTALATCPDDIPDENGEVSLYQVYWDIRDDWDGDDESCACDWDEIVSVLIYHVQKLWMQELLIFLRLFLRRTEAS